MTTGQQDRPIWSRSRVVTWSRGLGSAFTLVELLTVLAIMGIIAALAVPALKNFGHSDAMTAATRQMVNAVGRARQLAMSQRTTVYMVFVPTNFWETAGFDLSTLTPAERLAATNLAGEQLTGYTFMSHGRVGDQPGQHHWHYLAPWETLPSGTFVPLWKFYQSTSPLYFKDPIDPAKSFSIYPFATNSFPFPTESNTVQQCNLPYIAFNYLGQLVSSGGDSDPVGYGQDIPLARGSVLPAIDPATRVPQFGSPQVKEQPPGNSTNAYNIIHIDPLTGRTTLEEPQIQ